MKGIRPETSVGGGPSAPARLTGGQKSYKDDGEALRIDGMEGGVQLRLDWLDLTFPDNWQRTQLAVSLALGCTLNDWQVLPHGGKGYHQGAIGPGKALLWWDAPNRDDCHIQLPGQACRQVGSDLMAWLLNQSELYGAWASRLDLALDDLLRRISIEQLRIALGGPEAVSHAQQVQVIRGFGLHSEEIYGDTLYVGAPGSRQRLRVYDKNLESKGEIDAIRWELQDRDEAAESLRHQLAVSGGSWGKVARDRFVSFVDFKTPIVAHNSSVRTRMPWYESLMTGAEKVQVYPPVPARTLPQVADWLTHTAGPSMAMLVAVDGDKDALWPMVEYGAAHMKDKHRAMVLAERKAVLGSS